MNESHGDPGTPSAPPPARPPAAAPFYGPVQRYAPPPGGRPAGVAAQAGPSPAPGGARPPVAPGGPPSGPWAPAVVPSGPWAPTPSPDAAWGPQGPVWGPPRPWAPPLRGDYASWGRRVAATLIDSIPSWIALVVLVAGYLPMYEGLFRGDLEVGPRWGFVVVGTVLYLAALGLAVYNCYFLGGRTGQTVGKRVMKIWLVGQRSGRPIGALDAFLRNLLHVLDGFGYVGYLWPLWDEEHQTFADKIIRSVVVRTPVPPLTELERRQGWQA